MGGLPCRRGSYGVLVGRALWSTCKEVISLRRVPQRPAGTIINMCFWVSGAQSGYAILLSFAWQWRKRKWLYSGFVWFVLWYPWAGNGKPNVLFELVYACNNAIDFPGFYLILYILILLSPSQQSLNLCSKHSSDNINAWAVNQVKRKQAPIPHMHCALLPSTI